MTLPPLIPTPDQRAVIWKAAYEPTNACLNSSELGTGKTLVACEVAKARNAKTILVIAPLGTRLGWKVTAERQGIDLPFYWIKSDTKRDNIIKALKQGDPGIYFVGTQMFQRMGWRGRERTKTWGQVYPDMIILDESHKASNKKSRTYKTLQLATHQNYLKAHYKMAMSATPSGNKFDGAWSIPRWLWPEDDVVPASFDLWMGRWASTEYDPFSFSHKKITGEKNPGSWYASLPCHIHLEARNHESVFIERFVELSPKQRKMYDQLEKDYFAWLGENALAVDLPITMRIRQRQATLAELSIDDDGEVSFHENAHSTKADAVISIIQDDIDEAPALIYSDSRKFNQNVMIPRIVKAGYVVEAWDGSVSQAEREDIKNRFMSGETRYLVATIPALAEGVDGMQHATNNIIWITKSEDGILNEQATGRVVRQGQNRSVNQFIITALNTHDEKSYRSLTDEALARRKSVLG